jgi:hypothetical protein
MEIMSGFYGFCAVASAAESAHCDCRIEVIPLNAFERIKDHVDQARVH